MDAIEELVAWDREQNALFRRKMDDMWARSLARYEELRQRELVAQRRLDCFFAQRPC